MGSKGLMLQYKANKHSFCRETSKNSKGLTFKNTLALNIFGLDRSYKTELDAFFDEKNGGYSKDVPSGQAFIQARKKIKHLVFKDLNSTLVNSFYKTQKYETWNSYRLLAIDGSMCHVPDTKENRLEFGENGTNQYDKKCPRAIISILHDPLNKITVDSIMTNGYIGEKELANRHMKEMKENDLILYDRGYPSYFLFMKHEALDLKFCMRLSTGTFTNLCAPILIDGVNDIIVDYLPTNRTVMSCKEEGLKIKSSKIRLIKIELENGDIEVLATNIFDKRLKSTSFKKLYHLRWGIEEQYKMLKCRLELEDFSGKITEFVYQDFYADILKLNLSTIATYKSREVLKTDYENKKVRRTVNCSYALTMTRRFLSTILFKSKACIKNMLEITLERLVKNSMQIRPGRSYPRETKPLRSGYSQSMRLARV